MTQPPVRYENYPPDDSETPEANVPVVRPYIPDTIPPPPVSGGTSRRTLVGLVIGIPVAGIILSAMAMGSNARNGSGTGFDGTDGTDGTDDSDGSDDSDGTDDSSDPGAFGEDFSVGSYSATAPSGWSVHEDGSSTVQVTNGANRLTAHSLDTATSTLAVDEIARLVKGHDKGFTGKLGDPADRSTADAQHATLDGTGKFQGKAARLTGDLWIDDDGSGLLVVRILTAKPASVISTEAQEMFEELSEDF